MDRVKQGKGHWERQVLSGLADPMWFAERIQRLAAPFRDKDIHLVAAFEALGFPFGAAVALQLNAGLILVRKLYDGDDLAGYESELIMDYSDQPKAFRVLASTIFDASRVLIIDDYLETGGQLRAADTLLRRLGADVIGAAFLGRACYAGLDTSFFSGILHECSQNEK